MKRRTKNRIKSIEREKLICEIINAIREAGGITYLKQPLTVYADEIGEQVPIKVTRLLSKENTRVIEIGKGYTDLNLNNEQLNKIKLSLQ